MSADSKISLSELRTSGDSLLNIACEDGYRDTTPLIHSRKGQTRAGFDEHREPLTHILNKSFAEKFFSSCFNEEKTRLTSKELLAFYSLKFNCNISFDSEKDHHNRMVGSLWFALCNETMGDQIPNPRWNDFGFQNIDPRTDFRGAGLTGLNMLIHYAENYPERIKRMAESKDDFLAAASSINVTHHLIKYFHLLNSLVYEKDKAEICSRKALKNFCKFLVRDEDVLYNFHELLFTDLYEIWIDLKKKKKGVTIMDFKICLDEMKRKLNVAMNWTHYKNYDQFKLKYSNLSNWDGKSPM